MANLTTLLYPVSTIVSSLPGNIVNSTSNLNTFNGWNSFSTTTTTGLTSKIFSFYSLIYTAFVSDIDGISFAPYDQYLQIWTGTVSWDFNNSGYHGSLIWTQKIKSNENFNFKFSRGLAGNPIHIVNSTTPIVYTGGESDLFATVRYIGAT